MLCWGVRSLRLVCELSCCVWTMGMCWFGVWTMDRMLKLPYRLGAK